VSTHRCQHGNTIADTVGEYRCYECQPFGPNDLESELQAADAAVEEALAVRDARISELERVVAQLAERAGVTFNPPEGE
jgi:hypothetical protein